MNHEHTQKDTQSVESRVLTAIAQQDIKPAPHWKFVVRNDALWALGSLFVALGGLAVAIIIFSAANADFDLYRMPQGGLSDFIFDLIPLVWLLLLAVCALAAYYNFKNTNRGYRFPFTKVLLVMLGAAVAIGALLFATGVAALFDGTYGKYVPLHRPIIEHKRMLWLNPVNGMVAGEVLDINEDLNSFSLKDFSGQPWMVDAASLTEKDWLVLKESLETGALVRVAGLPVTQMLVPATTSIVGCTILPWQIAGAPTPTPSRSAGLLRHILEQSPERKIGRGRTIECESVRSYLVRPEGAPALPAN